jgi:hypothetical protein
MQTIVRLCWRVVKLHRSIPTKCWTVILHVTLCGMQGVAPKLLQTKLSPLVTSMTATVDWRFPLVYVMTSYKYIDRWSSHCLP